MTISKNARPKTGVLLENVNVTIRVDPQLYGQVTRLAQEQDRSMSQVCRILLRAGYQALYGEVIEKDNQEAKTPIEVPF